MSAEPGRRRIAELVELERYPIDAASQIAVEAAIEALTADGPPELVRFVLFSPAVLTKFEAALKYLKC